ncbi:hypothetical protein WJX72_012001 [[Myrmecia] bisecta]|uniref:Uncharacterized protein n=1 Tax=[Myrmecia] bisecta TaxID=41462 RepID=A0AAW1PAX4_9CHLO
MLREIHSGAAHWHTLAAYFPQLQRAGFDGLAVEVETGLARATQNVYQVALNVYKSLEKSEDMSREQLAFFDQDGGPERLYELRFLSADARAAAATYVANFRLDIEECQQLARAIKDHERRQGSKEGFTASPGDCLAFKFYREALEAKQQGQIQVLVRKGLELASSDSAVAKLAALVEQAAAKAEEPKSAAVLNIVRLTHEEMAFRPVAYLPSLDEATPDAIAPLPVISQTGDFAAFTITGGADVQWVALPSWNMVLLATRPAALYIPNCRDYEVLLQATNAQTDDEKKRLVGSGLLLIDRHIEQFDERDFYLVPSSTGGVEIVPSTPEAMGTACGRVILICRPPSRDPGVAAETSELLNV